MDERKIDYESRRRDYLDLAKAWAEGGEDEYHFSTLARQYTVIKGIDVNQYLGYEQRQGIQEAT